MKSSKTKLFPRATHCLDNKEQKKQGDFVLTSRSLYHSYMSSDVPFDIILSFSCLISIAKSAD